MGITVVTSSFNESKRIRRFVESFSGFDEIIIIDKCSPDGTQKLAEAAGATVLSIPYTDAGDIYRYGAELARNDWLLTVTVSDVVHPEMVKTLLESIRKCGDKTKVFFVPYIVYALGISGRFSIFDSKYRPCLVNKNFVKFRDRVHEELEYPTETSTFLPFDPWIAIHHLSSPDLDSSLERIVRYTKREPSKYPSSRLTVKRRFMAIFRPIFDWSRRQGWRGGWDSVALLVLRLTYEMVSFLRVYIEVRGINAEEVYESVAQDIRENKKK